MENYNYNGSTEYEKVILLRFLNIGCNCGCSKIIPKRSLLNYVRRFKLSLNLNKIYF